MVVSSKNDSKQMGWFVTQQGYSLKKALLYESLFAQANGYIGIRGTYDETLTLSSCEGTYLNGVYSQQPISYGESAYGFATHNQKILQVPNGKKIALVVDGSVLTADTHSHEGYRKLDMHHGLLTRFEQWTLPSGKTLVLNTRRFVSMANHQIVAIEYTFMAKNFEGDMTLISSLDGADSFQGETDDPRVGHLSMASTLKTLEQHHATYQSTLVHQVEGTQFHVVSNTLDDPTGLAPFRYEKKKRNQSLEHHYHLSVQKNRVYSFYKWVGYHHRTKPFEKRQIQSSCLALSECATQGFETCFRSHKAVYETFWEIADIEIQGQEALQQGLRFNSHHIFQSVSRTGQANIGAKGLTGPGYDGHYFWDTEVYVIPFLSLTQPSLAKTLLSFRIHTLPQAKQRAKEMSLEKGALFPWRTIGGQECSAYFPAGTAQYHINAAIAYAFKTYYNATADLEIFWQGGAELLFETARLWLELGHYNASQKGRFCIDGVTGPDEYTAMVNNNFYTNAMAKMHLLFALKISEILSLEDERRYRALYYQVDLSDEELINWRKAAETMYLPYDAEKAIHKQDDSFLNKKIWDFKKTPKEKYPLLLHFHPLNLYRHQVLKQADVVLAMYLLDDDYDVEQKARNLAYYEPLTTHDSSLSSCIHSIQYSETKQYEKAYHFFKDTVRMDLDNHHNNSEHGVHIANMAGSWACIVNGFAGLRIRSDHLSFNPHLPKDWEGYAFSICFQGRILAVKVSPLKVVYQLKKGANLTLKHCGKQIHLYDEQPLCAVPLSSSQAVFAEQGVLP